MSPLRLVTKEHIGQVSARASIQSNVFFELGLCGLSHDAPLLLVHVAASPYAEGGGELDRLRIISTT